jgi:acetylornithine/N-succinyldiaminopimelate aminotransferase
MTVIEEFNSHIMPTYGRYGVVFENGENCIALDENQKKYIDFGSGIGVNSLGYCDSDWVNAVTAQVAKLNHTSNYYYTAIQSDFAKKLCEITGYSKIFLGNSGAEANECAFKIARKYSFDKYGENRNKIITLKNSFHGRTLATLTATGQEDFHRYFHPFPQGFDYITPEVSELSKIDDTVCGVMIELIQGEGGVNVLDTDFVKELEKICKEKDILLIADEVQTGVCRTGTFLSSEQFGISPDITTLAKGIAGGLPMGICLANSKCCDTLTAGTHGSTFGGNPICCAGGLAVLEKAEKILDSVREKGIYFKEKLSALDGVSNVSGLGLMIGITLKNKTAKDVAQECLNRGLLVLTAKDKVRLLPPLTISYKEIDEGIKILSEIISE